MLVMSIKEFQAFYHYSVCVFRCVSTGMSILRSLCGGQRSTSGGGPHLPSGLRLGLCIASLLHEAG